MDFFKEFKKFIKSILFWIYFLIGFSFFFFLFGLKEIGIFGRRFLFPLPVEHSFSIQIFKKIQQDFLPAGVQLIVTNPLSAFLAQVLISILLAVALTFPFFLYGIIKYLSPALLKQEKKAFARVLFPSVFLFLSGCFFAYFFLIPLTFKILYPYTAAIGAIPFFSVNEFITLVLSIMITTGIMFLLPVFMALLSFLGIVEPGFWRINWRYSLLFFLIFSAIITPDGTGITMMILFMPLAGLYFLGCLVPKKSNQGKVEII